MSPDPTDLLERLSHSDLIRVVRDLVGEVTRLRAENERLRTPRWPSFGGEHQTVKDELARVKKLPPRPPIKPSGMEKATSENKSEKSGDRDGAKRGRGPLLERLKITATVVVKAQAPAGSRHKGYEEIVIQDLSLQATATLYRRERWETPDGDAIVAALDAAVVGGFGGNLHRTVLQLYFQGQMSCERIVAYLNDLGVTISKRQVVRC